MQILDGNISYAYIYAYDLISINSFDQPRPIYHKESGPITRGVYVKIQWLAFFFGIENTRREFDIYILKLAPPTLPSAPKHHYLSLVQLHSIVDEVRAQERIARVSAGDANGDSVLAIDDSAGWDSPLVALPVPPVRTSGETAGIDLCRGSRYRAAPVVDGHSRATIREGQGGSNAELEVPGGIRSAEPDRSGVVDLLDLCHGELRCLRRA